MTDLQQEKIIIEKSGENRITPNKKVKPTNFMLPSDAKDFSEAPEELKAMLGGADEEE
ncbi:MAG: hypothetical protein II047_03095 [Bacteroidales bacterium]|nr:hypothetical protein [Bacteroidales bacterium]